jgi:hypothetical protein
MLFTCAESKQGEAEWEVSGPNFLFPKSKVQKKTINFYTKKEQKKKSWLGPPKIRLTSMETQKRLPVWLCSLTTRPLNISNLRKAIFFSLKPVQAFPGSSAQTDNYDARIALRIALNWPALH